MRKVTFAFGAVASFIEPAMASDEASLPELFTMAYADCVRSDFIAAANGFPLDSEKLAAVEMAAKRFNQIDQDTSEKEKRLACQYALRVLDQRHTLSVMTWNTKLSQLEWLDFEIKTLQAFIASSKPEKR